jgi:O-antigen ligase
MQSRGTLVCYFSSMAFIIFFITRNDKNYKIKKILIFIIIPIFLYFSVNHYINENIKKEDEIKTYNRILYTHTGGRTSIWSYILNNYEYKKIFGYGPQGDRFFLKDFEKKKYFGDNASNIFIYSLVSGGIISLLFLILIFFNIFLIIKKFIKNKSTNFYENSLIKNFSIICLIFFSIRSIFENSFGVFGVDFLITYLSLSYLVSLKNNFNSR